MSPWRSGAAITCIVVAFASTAHAEPSESELATARQLFTEAVALEDAHDWAGALDRFRRVAAIKQTPQVRYNLGLCLAATGQLVEAENELSPVADLTGDANALALAALAKKKLAELRPRIPRLVATLPPGTTATVTLDGAPLSPALVGTPMHVDPGPHALEATLPSGGHLSASVVAVEGAPAPVMAVLAPPARTVGPPAPHHQIPRSAWVTGGAAAVSLATALALALARVSTVSSLNSQCGPGGQYCPQSAHGQVNLVDAETIAADVFAGVGVASAVATGVLIQFAPLVPASPNASGFGASITGTF